MVHGVLGPAVHTVGEIADAHAGAGPAGQLLADDVPVDGVIDESRCDAVPRDDPQPRPCAHVVGVGQNIRWHVARAQHAPCTRVVVPVEFGIACAAWEYEFEVGSVGLCRERAEHQRAAADARPVHRFDAVSGDRVQHTGIALHGHLQGAGDPCAVPKPRGPAVGPVKGGKRVLVATDRPSAAAFENRRAKTGLSQTECCHRTAEPATDDDGRRRVRGLRGVRGSAGGRRHRGERPEADRTPKDSSPGHDRAPAHLVDIDLCPTYRDGRRLHGPTVGPRT